MECLTCNAPACAGQTFCGNCGASLRSPASQQDTDSLSSIDMDFPRPSAMVCSGETCCVRCRQVVPTGCAFCVHCGMQLSNAADGFRDSFTFTARTCARCGSPLWTPQAVYCKRCENVLLPRRAKPIPLKLRYVLAALSALWAGCLLAQSYRLTSSHALTSIWVCDTILIMVTACYLFIRVP